jgi:hypothetical protein
LPQSAPHPSLVAAAGLKIFSNGAVDPIAVIIANIVNIHGT